MLLAGISTNDGTLLSLDNKGRRFRSAVLRTDEQRLVHIISSSIDPDGNSSLTLGRVGTPPLTGLTQCMV